MEPHTIHGRVFDFYSVRISSSLYGTVNSMVKDNKTRNTNVFWYFLKYHTLPSFHRLKSAYFFFLENPEKVVLELFDLNLKIKQRVSLFEFLQKNEWRAFCWTSIKTQNIRLTSGHSGITESGNIYVKTSKVNELFCLTYFNSICFFFFLPFRIWICTVSVIKQIIPYGYAWMYFQLFSSRGWNFDALKKYNRNWK